MLLRFAFSFLMVVVLAYIVKGSCRVSSTEKGSKFIGILEPCESEAQFERALSHLREEFADATHVTYAFRYKGEYRLDEGASDDGEPRGTAGRPILSRLQGHELVDVALFVVRYYGGVKLGTGGLVRAYGQCAALAIAEAELLEVIPKKQVEISLSYSQEPGFIYLLKKLEGSVISKEYSDKVIYKVEIPAFHYQQLITSYSVVDE